MTNLFNNVIIPFINDNKRFTEPNLFIRCPELTILSLSIQKSREMEHNNQRGSGKKRRSLYVDWKEIDGATRKKRILALKPTDKNEFICPANGCLHIAFKSQRGIRKHINNIHPWYMYFDEQPKINREEAKEQSQTSLRASTNRIPAFSLETGIGKDFLTWLQTPCGGGRAAKDAKNIGRRAMKFLMASFDENTIETVLKPDYIDCCLGSPNIIMGFLKLIMDNWGLQSSGALSYMKSIGDLLDFRKANGVTDNVLRNFAVAEVYIRRGKENLAKKKKMEYSRNLELESLISRDSWATLDDMEKVIPFHSPRYQSICKMCKDGDLSPSISELAFATRFIVTFLFLRVKCTRPMTFQFLSLQMVDQAKLNGGYVDQTQFKTQDKYIFDTLILTDDVMKVLDSYIKHVRPLMHPKCEYLIVTYNGTQYTAFGNAMSLLVHQAIGKTVNPTRYRQIVETESALALDDKERDTISKDQKHSSEVAKRIYQKRLSREVATEARSCMTKLTGSGKESHTQALAESLMDLTKEPCSSKDNNVELSSEENTENEGEIQCITKDVVDVTMDEVESDHDSQIASKNMETTQNTHRCDIVNVANEDDISLLDSNIPKKTVDLVERDIKKEELENSMDTKSKRFTAKEDTFLKNGIQKYGYGNWKKILVDEDYSFPYRTRDTLRMRAKTLNLNTKTIDSKRKKYSVRSRSNAPTTNKETETLPISE